MDVHVPAAVTEGLRRRGIDVRTSQEDGTREASDETLLERAAMLRRILLTQDQDMLAIAAQWQAAGREFSGVVFARQIGTSLGQLIDDLQLIAECCEAAELASRVIYAPLPSTGAA
jgi:predicted nuclease of predicted toxin-antitoxin system